MALTPSTMVPLGRALPDLTLPGSDGGEARLWDLLDGHRGLLVLFLSNHCPYVQHVQPVLGPLASDLADAGVKTVGIHSNDVDARPEDGPEAVARVSVEAGYGFPQLMDPDQAAAQAFEAACTPDVFLFDGDGRLVYRGQLDSSRPSAGEPSGMDVRRAVEALCAGERPLDTQHPATGCNIKWKPGHEPAGRGVLTRRR